MLQTHSPSFYTSHPYTAPVRHVLRQQARPFLFLGCVRRGTWSCLVHHGSCPSHHRRYVIRIFQPPSLLTEYFHSRCGQVSRRNRHGRISLCADRNSKLLLRVLDSDDLLRERLPRIRALSWLENLPPRRQHATPQRSSAHRDPRPRLGFLLHCVSSLSHRLLLRPPTNTLVLVFSPPTPRT